MCSNEGLEPEQKSAYSVVMTYKDEFEEPPRGHGLLSNIGPKAAFFIVLIALSFMIGVVWKLYAGGGNGADGQNVPIVRAEQSPYKVIPDDPGGMEIPNKDSTLFGSNSDSKVENLLAKDDNEEPLPRSQLFAGLNTDSTDNGNSQSSPNLQAEAQATPLDQPLDQDQERIVEQAKEAEAVVENFIQNGVEALNPSEDDETINVVVEDPTPAKAAPVAVKKAPVKAPAKVEVTVPSVTPEVVKDVVTEKQISLESPTPSAEEKINIIRQEEKLKLDLLPEKSAPVVTSAPTIQKVEPAVKATAAPTPLMAGDYYVQVVSVKDRSRAEGEWNRLKKKYAALSGYSYRIQSADLGERGTYYRVQAGPVSKSQATETCNAIKRVDKNGCLVKKK